MAYLANVHKQNLVNDHDGTPDWFVRFDLNAGSVGLHFSMGMPAYDLAIALRAAEKAVREKFSKADEAEFQRLTRAANRSEAVA